MRTIKITNTGPDVEQLQKLLGLKVDGVFGPKTAAAVLAFQKREGLVTDGVVGPMTWSRLTVGAPAEVTLSPEETEWGTEGPLPEHEPGTFTNGYYSRARCALAHEGRIGGTITPRTIVLHTTDMMPNTFHALVNAWQNSPGKGSCAHFLLGRSAADGLVQTAPISRNANHAGGTREVDGKKVPYHGWYAEKGGKTLHPNLVAIGIEIHAAGRLGKCTEIGYVQRETGRVIPDDEVWIDSSGVGWHKVTEYQLETLEQLLDDLRPQLTAPGGTVKPLTIRPNGEPPAWAKTSDVTIAGHVSLDPNRKTDPGPQVMEWLANYLSRAAKP